MGQRHQIYCKLPYEFQQKKDYADLLNPQYVPSDMIALHHQWMYGFGPLQQMKQFFEFHAKGVESPYYLFGEDGKHGSGNPENALKSLYSLDLSQGTYSELTPLSNEEAKNPLYADNNDGISIIDVSSPSSPKYAFMFFGSAENGIEALKPITAEQYVRSYYNEEHYTSEDFKDDTIKDYESAIAELSSYFNNISLLTERECELLFPSMYVKELFK